MSDPLEARVEDVKIPDGFRKRVEGEATITVRFEPPIAMPFDSESLRPGKGRISWQTWYNLTVAVLMRTIPEFVGNCESNFYAMSQNGGGFAPDHVSVSCTTIIQHGHLENNGYPCWICIQPHSNQDFAVVVNEQGVVVPTIDSVTLEGFCGLPSIPTPGNKDYAYSPEVSNLIIRALLSGERISLEKDNTCRVGFNWHDYNLRYAQVSNPTLDRMRRVSQHVQEMIGFVHNHTAEFQAVAEIVKEALPVYGGRGACEALYRKLGEGYSKLRTNHLSDLPSIPSEGDIFGPALAYIDEVTARILEAANDKLEALRPDFPKDLLSYITAGNSTLCKGHFLLK